MFYMLMTDQLSDAG